jgi:uncharacterized protein (DUF2267 family)
MADHAEVLAIDVIRVVTDALRSRLAGSDATVLADARANIAKLLRDEFADRARTVRDERPSSR